MTNDTTTILQMLFATGPVIRQPVEFEWWLIRRRGRPFLLLPRSPADAHVALELYSAQRAHARLMCAVLPLFLRTPAAMVFERVRVRVDAASEMLQFMSQQSGVPVERLRAPAIKVGGLALHKSRFVMLLCDEANRPVKVVKAGLNARNTLGLSPEGWKTTNQEANQLECLPRDIVGCIRMTGRFSTPALTAFATRFFSGDSPQDDGGMENLFHSWLNPRAPVPLESLDSWRELAAAFAPVDPQMWQALSQAVQGKRIHSTVYHGDFAPWNIRATGEQNLQVFDWERARLEGIPGWDWFHFVVQTSILARRYHEKRVAAEIEQLFQSPRFRIYAAAARITDIVKPLLLAYLLHQKWVVKPIEGGETTERLYEFLAVRWQLKPAGAAVPVQPAKPGWLASGRQQLKFACDQLSNLAWEPTLSQIDRPSMLAQLRTHWRVVGACALAMASLLELQWCCNHHKDVHLSFTQFYLVPCLWLTLRLDRRWGSLAGTVAPIAVPLMRHVQSPVFLPLNVAIWNMVTGFFLFQMVILLVDRIRGQNVLRRGNEAPGAGGFAEHWAVILAAGLFLAAVVTLDVVTPVQLNLAPLYLLPCITLTMVVNRRWGTIAALAAAFVGPFSQRFEDSVYRHLPIELWNTAMRFLIFQAVVLILDRIRRENVLFFDHSQPAAPAAGLPVGSGEMAASNTVG